MPLDPWDHWDQRIKRSGRPSRVARDLTDVELLNLLATPEQERDHERRILKEEAHRRMRMAQELRLQQARSGEATRLGMRDSGVAGVPSRRDYVDRF